MAERPTRLIAGSALAIAVIVVAALAFGGGEQRHTLYAVVPEAAAVIPGQQIREAGQPVGRVGDLDVVDGGRAARVEFQIDDDVWPLAKGSTLALRWGGTVSYSNRYVALERADGDAPFAEGATIPAAAFTTPVEFDSVTSLFDRSMRRDTRALLNVGGRAFAASRSSLSASLQAAPPAVEQASHVFRALQDNERALETLLRSTDHVTAAVDAADPGVGPLLSGAGTTFRAIADEAQSLRVTLDRMTPTLEQAQITLENADGTLAAAGTLTGRLAPGVDELRRLSHPLSELLRTVAGVAPDARATLTSLKAATPALNPLISKAATLLPTIGSVGRQSVKQLKCIRPYTPDIASLFSNWADFFAFNDRKDKFARVFLIAIPAAQNFATYNSATAKKLFPGLDYAFPRPPGHASGTPWLLPKCGVGPEALDPSKDPEARG